MIYPRFWQQPRHEREKTIAHEMLHGLMGGVLDLIHHGQRGKLVTQEQEHAAVEQFTEHLATVLMQKDVKRV